VSKVADLERLIASTVKAFGRLDIMVNNAGIESRTSVLETTEQQYDKVLQVNLKSAFFGTQLAAKQMIKQLCEPMFRSLHLQLDQIIEGPRDYADQLAERLLVLGLAADGRLSTLTRTTHLSSFPEG
jgi:NAD(P)-dependent dehydrogenase (short-subunit alcohol dehydrogenase family)